MLIGFSFAAVFSALLFGPVLSLKILILAPSQFHSHLNFNVALARALTKEGHYVVGILRCTFKFFNVLLSYSILSSRTAHLNHWKGLLKFRATLQSPITEQLRKVKMLSQKQLPNTTSVTPKTFSSGDFTGRMIQCSNKRIYSCSHFQVSSLFNATKIPTKFKNYCYR